MWLKNLSQFGEFSSIIHVSVFLIILKVLRLFLDGAFREKEAPTLTMCSFFRHVKSTFLFIEFVVEFIFQPELRIFKTYSKRQNLFRNKTDIQNLENILRVPTLAIFVFLTQILFSTMRLFWKTASKAPLSIFWNILQQNECYNGVRTFHPMQFQPMQFQPLPFQPLTISTYCIFNRPQFRPKLILAI